MVKKFYFIILKKELLFFVNGFVVVLGCLEFVVECDFVVEVVEFVVFVVDFKKIWLYIIYLVYINKYIYKFDIYLIINFIMILLNFVSNNILR